MNFDLTEDQQLFADAVRQFARKESPLLRLRRLRQDSIGWEKGVWQRLAEQGFLGVLYPESLGGSGGTFVDVMLLHENLATTLLPEPVLASALLGGLPILWSGSPEQQRTFLTPMLAGKTSLALAFAERAARHAPARISLTARRDGDSYVLDGAKVWVPNGQAAEHIVVAARTAGRPGDAAGLSLFVLDRGVDGLSCATVLGMDSHHYGMLSLRAVRVPAERRLGTEGEALPILERALDYGAAAACCEAVGILQTMFEKTVEYLKTRKQFGVLIGTFQALQHRAVEMFVETELCRSIGLLVALSVEDVDAARRAAAVSAAKVQLGLGGKFVMQQALQLHGGIGVTDEHDVGLYFKRTHTLLTLCGDDTYHAQRFANTEPDLSRRRDGG